MYLVGLTGGIAAGKSTVAKRWVEQGGIEIDADQLARDVVKAGTPGAEAVREAGPLRQIALVHGEDPGRETLKSLLEERGFPTVHTPVYGDRIDI